MNQTLPEELTVYKKANVRPLGNTVLLAPMIKPLRSDGGIHLVDKYQDDRTQWVVLAVGPGYTTKKGELIAPEVKVGDRVLFDDSTGTGVKFTFEDGSRWAIVNANRIQMVF